MVELEQRRELVGVLLVPLQPFDQLELPLHQALTAPREVHEHGRVPGAHARLLGRQPQSLAVDGVERPGHLADLVARADRHGIDLGVVGVSFLDRLHGLREFVLRDLQRAVPQDLQGAQQLPADEEHDDRGEDEGDDQHRGQEPDAGAGVVGQLAGAAGQFVAQPVGDLAHRGEDGGARLGPLVGVRGVQQVPACVLTRQHRVDDALVLVERGTAHGPVEECALALGRRRGELGEPVRVPHPGGAHEVELARREAERDAVLDQGLVDRHLVAGDQEVVHRPGRGTEALGTDTVHHRGVDFEQRGRDRPVLLDGLDGTELTSGHPLADVLQRGELLVEPLPNACERFRDLGHGVGERSAGAVDLLSDLAQLVRVETRAVGQCRRGERAFPLHGVEQRPGGLSHLREFALRLVLARAVQLVAEGERAHDDRDDDRDERDRPELEREVPVTPTQGRTPAGRRALLLTEEFAHRHLAI